MKKADDNRFVFSSAQVNREFKRLISTQISQVLVALERAMDSGDPIVQNSGVHDARKCFKRLRALFYLLQPTSKRFYRQHNDFFRDHAKQLALTRDRASMLEAIRRLEQLDGNLTKDVGCHAVKQSLMDGPEQRQLNINEMVLPVYTSLSFFNEDFKQHNDDYRLTQKVLLRGMGMTYRDCRHGLLKVLRRGDIATYHDWRKRVKYHGYQLGLLKQIHTDWLLERVQQVDVLAEHLGNQHDYHMLRRWLKTEYMATGSVSDTGDGSMDAAVADVELLQQIAKRQQRVCAERAKHIGAKLFQEDSRRFTKRLKSDWRSWAMKLQ